MRDFADMPKVELHLHLEGAIPNDAMWRLVERHGGDPDVPHQAALAERYAYRDFAHFIDTWLWQTRFLDSYDAFRFAAEAVARSLAEQRIVYAEAFFSPSDFTRHGLEPAQIALAIRAGLDSVAGTDVALIVDVVRDSGPERARRTLDAVAEVAAEARIIGLGIGGSEGGFAPEPFAPVYRRAADLGLRRTAHAGEAAGPPSVWGALRALGVERIGHGVRAVEDPALVAHLVAEQVPLEVCPTSNVRTGVVSGWDEHPARRLIEAGAMVTLNSDDPAMFGSTLAGEYAAVAGSFGLDGTAVHCLATAAIDASWAADAVKFRLRADLDAWWRTAA